MCIKCIKELDDRDQDVHGEYLGSDYNGYGVVEVVENIVWSIIDCITLLLILSDARISARVQQETAQRPDHVVPR